jgi:hypothetical protein
VCVCVSVCAGEWQISSTQLKDIGVAKPKLGITPRIAEKASLNIMIRFEH